MTRLLRLAALCPLVALLALRPGAPQLPHIVVERDLPLKLVDGTTLYADVYRPEGRGRFPALLMRTPYDKEGAQQSGRLAMTVAAVRRGYVVVVQDTRGQFKSEGRFVPYSQEIGDGHETIEWVARLPYVDGQVGMFGLSYPGAVQWMAAPGAPASLKAIAPAMTFAHPNHFFYHGGIFEATSSSGCFHVRCASGGNSACRSRRPKKPREPGSRTAMRGWITGRSPTCRS